MYPQSFAAPFHADLPALLRKADRAVMPCPEFQRILVPFDGSRAAERALRHAISMSMRAPLKIALLNVQPPVMAGDVNPFISAEVVEANRKKLGAAVLQPATLVLQAHQVPYTASVVLGNVAVEIARTAERFARTKIVMGTRAMGILRSLFSRSVARRVVKRTTVPVTLVKGDTASSDMAMPAPAIPT